MATADACRRHRRTTVCEEARARRGARLSIRGSKPGRWRSSGMDEGEMVRHDDLASK